MIRSLASLRWRQLRWVALLVIVPVLWACNSNKLARPNAEPKVVVKNRFQQSVNRDLDLLFLIDDSSSMAPLQQKMRDRLPDFMNVLKGLPGGLPNLHVAVVSSSLGAGMFGNVPGCGPNTMGNLDGKFQHSAACTQLNAGEKFIKSVANPAGGRAENFTGDITDVFSCIANLGDKGCGFEHQFEAVRLALQLASADGTENSGFLRPQAYLAVVMLTNEDDCSVPFDSRLFDPGMLTVDTQYGGLQSYRCNEFGHRCDGAAPSPPHLPPGATVTLENCRSAEDNVLVTVEGFTEYLKSLKPGHPEQILVAAIAGPTTPYRVESKAFQLASGATEMQPSVVHSCTSGNMGTEYADPGVRIKQWLDGFGANAVLESICANDFSGAMVNIARVIGRALGAQCVTGDIAMKEGSTTEFDCDVTEVTTDAANNPVPKTIPQCQGGRPVTPCWEFLAGGMDCPNGRILSVCYDAGCTAGAKPQTKADALVSCSVD